ncbi:hypothetical protein [Runella zeae]|uniref:hypothetical protein n=1 Tax=Runella zeae TaxID=94255 RepID=UPI002357A821|nr:hypothetical protein [Runella zeae]
MISKLDIRIEGEVADLTPGTSFELELLNSMLNIDVPQGSRAVGITFPFTPHNHALLGFIFHPQSNTVKRNYAADIYIASNLVDSGYLYLRDAVNSYPMDFTSNIKEFFGTYQARLLTDIDLGVINLPANLNDTLSAGWYNPNGCVFPSVYNPTFYEKNVPSTFDGYVNKYTSGSYETTSPKTPMFFLKHILEKVATLAGVTYTGTFWNDVNTAKLLLYNVRAAAPASTIERRIFMPELTIGQLINGLRRTFNLYLRFDIYRRILRMDYAKSVYTSACEIDWSAQAPRIPGGNPVNLPGIELSWTLDTNDQLYKDVFFDPYATEGASGELLKVQSPFRPLLMNAGLPYTQQFGITVDQLDKKCVPGLLSWQGVSGGVPLANNQFGSTVMRWNGNEGLKKAFWQEEEAFRMSGFRIESRFGLGAAEIARMSAILRGESEGFPVVHMNGTNYLLERMVIPSEQVNLPLISAYRL